MGGGGGVLNKRVAEKASYQTWFAVYKPSSDDLRKLDTSGGRLQMPFENLCPRASDRRLHALSRSSDVLVENRLRN
jgi:hypothetical protein